MTDDSIDTSLLNNGIIFNENPVDGELDYYWDNETEICSPSLMPDNNFTINEFSGDSTYLEEKYFQNMANLLNKQNHNHVAQNELQSSKKENFSFEENDIDVDMDDVLLDDMVKEMTNALTVNNQEFKENEETLNNQEFEEFEDFEEPEEPKEPEEPEDPPSPTSPRDPEREGPVLSEEEEDTEEGGIHRLEHDPKFQDEAGLMYGDDSRGKIWPDDEGMDPMENQ